MKKIASIMGVLAMVGITTACDGVQKTKNGDTVVINFAGFLDGVQFPGGTAEGYPLKLGSGAFVPGFEEQLIGMTEGEERDINITFPEQYVEGLAGKAVVFKVKIVDIL